MNFCTVLPTHPDDRPGGAELQANLISKELASRGHECHYVAHRAGRESVTITDDVTVHRLDTKAGGIPPESVRHKIAEIDPDVCYFRIIKDLPIAGFLKTFSDSHIVFNVSHDAHCLSVFSDWPGKQDETPLHTVYRRTVLTARRMLLTVPDQIFVQTQKQAELLCHNRGISSTVIGNGHPVPEQDIKKLSPPIVLWLASIKKWKQPRVFLDVARRCSDLNCRFWMVGQASDQQLAEEVQSEIQSLSNTEYHGDCKIEESNEYIGSATIFVNTSRQEGFPNTFIQAWLHQTAVASLQVDPDGLLKREGIGHVANGDVGQLVNAIRRLHIDDDHRQQITAHARDYAVENHDICSIVDRIEDGLDLNQ